jgi:hypothetical protein
MNFTEISTTDRTHARAHSRTLVALVIGRTDELHQLASSSSSAPNGARAILVRTCTDLGGLSNTLVRFTFDAASCCGAPPPSPARSRAPRPPAGLGRCCTPPRCDGSRASRRPGRKLVEGSAGAPREGRT